MINSQYNNRNNSNDFEAVSDEIITIPDQSLSVQEILERYRRGTISFDEMEDSRFYDGDYNEDYIDTDDMIQPFEDLTDISNSIEKNKNKIE